MRIIAILLAAGSSARFEADKLVTDYRGRPLYLHALDALTSSPLVDSTLVVVNPDFRTPSDSGRCRFVVNRQHREGMGSSVRIGVRAAPEGADAYLLALADMPRITPGLIGGVLACYQRAGKSIVVPVHAGRRGHPVVMSAVLRPRLLRIRGDVGARQILRESPEMVGCFETDDPAVLFDVDTPGDMEVPA